MPDFNDREQILVLKLLWMQNELETIQGKLFNTYMCLVSLDCHLKESSEHLAKLQYHLKKSSELREYIYLDLGEMSHKINDLKQL